MHKKVIYMIHGGKIEQSKNLLPWNHNKKVVFVHDGSM